MFKDDHHKEKIKKNFAKNYSYQMKGKISKL